MKNKDINSLDHACYGHALKISLFCREKMVCTKTLYNYIDLGLISLKNSDLPEKLSRNTKQKKVRENKKKLGDSIDLRDESVENAQSSATGRSTLCWAKRAQRSPAL